MKLGILRLACAALMCTAVSSVVYAQETVLRYRWSEGNEARYRLTQQSSMTMSGLPGAGTMAIDQKIVQVMRMTVEKVAADGSVTLRETFESVQLELTSPAGKTVFDSTALAKTGQPANPVETVMSTIVGESIVIVLTPNGSVSKVEGMSRLMEKAFGSLAQDPAIAQFTGQLASGFSDESMASTLGQSFVMFPDRALKAGDTWTSQVQMNNPLAGKMSSVTTYTLKGIDKTSDSTIARIAQTLGMKQEAGNSTPSPLDQLGMTVKMGESKSEGEILFDVSKGRLQRTSSESEMPLSLSMTNPALGDLNMTGLTRTTMLMELLEK